MVNVTPRIVILAPWKAKFSEVENEFLRCHASYTAGLPPNGRENEANKKKGAGST